LVFVIAALLPPRAASTEEHAPSVTLLVPARNEEAGATELLNAIARLEYPSEQLFVVLVTDGSTDTTAELFDRWATARPRALALHLAPVGKFEALNRALVAAPPSEVVAICDADLLPHREWLRRLVRPLGDEQVGATAGLVWPANAASGIVARYAAVEAWVHQLVTSAAKDRLGLNPPPLAASAYRRSALEEIGLFASDGSGGDAKAAAALTRTGWRTRFVPDAVAATSVVDRWDDYWHQHVRWARNLFATFRVRGVALGQPRRAGLGLRIEGWLAAAGYTDRIVFVSVCAFAGARALPLWVPGSYLAIAAVEIAVALGKARVRRAKPSYLLAAGVVFVVDALASVVATADHLLRRRPAWRQGQRGVLTDGSADPS
jgi:glycosyltransferase involved in cell wall biosynthesis